MAIKRNQFRSRRVNHPGLAISRIVRRQLRRTAEHKQFVQTVANTTSSLTGQVQAISQGIIEGDEANQRSGRQITVVGLDLRLTTNMPVLAVTGNLRFILFMDTMNTGVVPAPIDILNTLAVVSAYSITQFQEKRFRILHDEILPFVAGGADQQQTRHVIKTVNTKVSYLLPNSATAANGRNSVFALFITDNAVSPIYNYDIAVQYLDM